MNQIISLHDCLDKSPPMALRALTMIYKILGDMKLYTSWTYLTIYLPSAFSLLTSHASFLLFWKKNTKHVCIQKSINLHLKMDHLLIPSPISILLVYPYMCFFSNVLPCYYNNPSSNITYLNHNMGKSPLCIILFPHSTCLLLTELFSIWC